jgi:hypothetical protein
MKIETMEPKTGATEMNGSKRLSHLFHVRAWARHSSGAYNFLDLVPKGRDEDGLDFTMDWVRRHESTLTEKYCRYGPVGRLSLVRKAAPRWTGRRPMATTKALKSPQI